MLKLILALLLSVSAAFAQTSWSQMKPEFSVTIDETIRPLRTNGTLRGYTFYATNLVQSGNYMITGANGISFGSGGWMRPGSDGEFVLRNSAYDNWTSLLLGDAANTGFKLVRNGTGVDFMDGTGALKSGIRLGTITAGTWNGSAIDLAIYSTGTLPATSLPAETGEVTRSAGSAVNTIDRSTTFIWTGDHTIRKTGTQLTLGYDAGNTTTFATGSGGRLAVVPSGGALDLTGHLGISGSVVAANTSTFGFGTRLNITTPASGKVLFADSGTGFTELAFGELTSSKPSIWVNGTGLEAKLGDNSAFTTWKMSGINLDGLTASLPLKLDSSKNATAAAIDVSGSEVTGTLAAGRFPALTGDVSNSAGSLTTTIAAGAVSLSKMANIATASVLGRNTAGTGSPEVLTTLPNGVQDNITRLGAIGTAATFTGGADFSRSTYPQLKLSWDGTYQTGLHTTNNGDFIINPTSGGYVKFPYLTPATPMKVDSSGNITSQAINLSGTDVTSTLPWAKIASLSASKLFGRGDSGAGAPEEITIGSGLSLSGTTLTATGGGVGGSGTIGNIPYLSGTSTLSDGPITRVSSSKVRVESIQVGTGGANEPVISYIGGGAYGIIDLRDSTTSTNQAGIVVADVTVRSATGLAGLYIAETGIGIPTSGTISFTVGGTDPVIRAGAGSPETVITAPKGSLYLRNDGGAGTTLYVKESGSGNTGWVGK